MVEYRVETTKGLLKDKRLDALGKKGWELVNILPYEGLFLYYFKKRSLKHTPRRRGFIK